MLHAILFSLLILALAVVLMAVKLFFGKPFVHTHVEGNKALAEKGLCCARGMDKREREARKQRKL